jgi:glycopeptide antibiotics resistance protein
VTRRRLLTVLILIGYALGIAGVTLLPITPRSAGYWAGEPWWTMLRWVPFDVDAPSFTLNVIMFVPFGILVPALWPRADAVRRLALRAACASLAIESAQFALGMTLGSRRTVDVNDLIANTAGALLGLLVFRLAVPLAAHRAGLVARPRGVTSADPAPVG